MPTTSPTVPTGRTRLRLKRVLLGTDFSEGSKHALRIAIALCIRFEADLTIAHVIVPDSYPAGVAAVPVEPSAEVTAAKHRMAQFISEPRISCIKHDVRFAEASSFLSGWETLVEEQSFDLIIVASHGRSGIEKLFLGSGAEVIVRHSQIPVMVIGPHVQPEKMRYKSVVLALQLEGTEETAIDFAIGIVGQMCAQLTVIHVSENNIGTTKAPKDMLSRLHEAVPPAAAFCGTKYRVPSGDPVSQLLLAVEQEEANLIIIPTTRPSAAADRPPWLTFTKLVQSAPVPVISVRR